MADPALTPGSWLQFLEQKVDAQAEAIDIYDDYFNGEHRLAFATMKFREAFSRFFPPMADNWMKLVVQAPVSRLVVQGFRFDPDPTKPTWEMEADRDAWEIWQASNFDAASRIVHTEAVKSGTAYVLVSPPSEPGGWPQLTPEAASQVYVYLDPANRRRRLAAIKKWVSELDGMAYANVYLPDVIFKWVSQSTYREGMKIQWQRRPDDPGGRNPIGVVPLVPLENEPDLLCGGRSDLEAAIPIQDAVNKFCLDMQVSSEFHAFPQRYATGWERATDDVGNELTGREVELASGQSRLWRAESTDTQFGQLAPGDVNNYIAPIELYIDHLAAVTQTPAYYLKGKMANLSADALHAADQGLVDRVRSKLLSLGDGWEEVMRTAFLAKGDKARGHATTAETIWADPETKSLGQLVDAAAKLRQVLSVPLEMCWQLLGWSPEQIRQAREMAAQPALPEESGAPQVLGPDGMPIAAIPSSLPAPVPPPPGQGQLASIPTRA